MSDELNVKNMRVALANYDPRELRVQKLYLEEQCAFIECAGFSRGHELLEQLRRGEEYDVIVLGSQLEDMDETEFIAHLRQLKSRPLLLLFGEGHHSENTLSCLRADGSCYIARQTELKELMEELYKAAGRRSARIETACRQLCAAWGARGQDNNCAYLAAALRAACESSGRLAIRKELLLPVVERYSVSVAAVDSGLRRLVDEFEAKSTESYLEFKRESGFEAKRPTTGKLIYALREYMRRRGMTK